MNIYIDSNIWLGIYHFSSDDLSEFSKLKDKSEVKIFLPEQTIDEVRRNRMARINDARKSFEHINLNQKIPNIYKEFESDAKEFRELSSEFTTFFNGWKEKVSNAIIEKELEADVAIRDLFEKSIKIDTTEYYDKAVYRMNIGNPPGKNNSYGDAIIWEALLNYIPEEQDLFIITDDRDFYDDKKNEIANSFLTSEWRKEKSSSIYVFNTLGSFFDKHLTFIKLREEQEKNRIISELEESTNFSNTHKVIEQLSNYLGTFSEEQVNRLVEAAIENSQIYYIFNDSDVREFYDTLLESSKSNLIELEDLNEHSTASQNK